MILNRDPFLERAITEHRRQCIICIMWKMEKDKRGYMKGKSSRSTQGGH